jgi:hypothetical protein
MRPSAHMDGFLPCTSTGENKRLSLQAVELTLGVLQMLTQKPYKARRFQCTLSKERMYTTVCKFQFYLQERPGLLVS